MMMTAWVLEAVSVAHPAEVASGWGFHVTHEKFTFPNGKQDHMTTVSEEKPKLEWTVVKTFDDGAVRVEITRAINENGPMFSFQFLGTAKNRVSKFIRERDLPSVVSVAELAKDWARTEREKWQAEHGAVNVRGR